MLASPDGFPKLDIEAEWAKLAEALHPLERRGLVTLERLPDVVPEHPAEQLRTGEYNVFHFTWHGGFDEQSEDGVLALTGWPLPASSAITNTPSSDCSSKPPCPVK